MYPLNRFNGSRDGFNSFSPPCSYFPLKLRRRSIAPSSNHHFTPPRCPSGPFRHWFREQCTHIYVMARNTRHTPRDGVVGQRGGNVMRPRRACTRRVGARRRVRDDLTSRPTGAGHACKCALMTRPVSVRAQVEFCFHSRRFLLLFNKTYLAEWVRATETSWCAWGSFACHLCTITSMLVQSRFQKCMIVQYSNPCRRKLWKILHY